MRDDISDLYHSSYRRLVAQVYAFTTDLSEAQDAVQEAFARALARHGRLSGIDTPEAWLRTVAVNIVKRRWRRKQLLDRIMLRERPVARLLQEAPEPDRTDLRQALATIPRTYREVIVLHYLADLPVVEVAAILEVPVGTVKSRLSRGREALKGLLDDIETPPLSQVELRAGQIKRRRHVAQIAAAVAVLVLSGTVLLPWRSGAPIAPATSVAPSPAPVMSWEEAGLRITSVPEVGTVPDLPGVIDDFDIDGRDLLHTDAGVYARSGDGGQTWEIINYARRTGLYPVGFDVKWESKRRTPGGLWWVAGLSGGRPSFGYSPDRNSWQFVDLPAGDGVSATVDGESVFAFVLQGQKIIGGYRISTDGFESSAAGGDFAVNGEPVVLPDGRIMIADAGKNWRISSDRGQTWGRVNMAQVGSFHQTTTGYVMLHLFGAGWVAISSDGVNWQKLPIR